MVGRRGRGAGRRVGGGRWRDARRGGDRFRWTTKDAFGSGFREGRRGRRSDLDGRTFRWGQGSVDGSTSGDEMVRPDDRKFGRRWGRDRSKAGTARDRRRDRTKCVTGEPTDDGNQEDRGKHQ